jgi:hypothetical protein
MATPPSADGLAMVTRVPRSAPRSCPSLASISAQREIQPLRTSTPLTHDARSRCARSGIRGPFVLNVTGPFVLNVTREESIIFSNADVHQHLAAPPALATPPGERAAIAAKRDGSDAPMTL